MKYLLLLSLLCLVSCSESDEHAKAREKEQEMLSHAEKKQEETQPAPEVEAAPVEPTCKEVEYNEIYQGNILIATCHSEEVKVEACGVVAQWCLDKSSYMCLKEVRVKFIKKEECE